MQKRGKKKIQIRKIYMQKRSKIIFQKKDAKSMRKRHAGCIIKLPGHMHAATSQSRATKVGLQPRGHLF